MNSILEVHMVKKIKLVVIIILLLLTISGCNLWHPGTPEEYRVPVGNYRLVADFSNGTLEGELKFMDKPIKSKFYDSKSKEKVYKNENIEEAIMEIADYLSEWTGLDFKLNSVENTKEGLIVLWSEDSTLLAGLDDREQKEEFHFFDAVSLNWFMMDSLKSSIDTNVQTGPIYYQMDGKVLRFQNQEDMETQGVGLLYLDEPYYGSYYYVSKVSGEKED